MYFNGEDSRGKNALFHTCSLLYLATTIHRYTCPLFPSQMTYYMQVIYIHLMVNYYRPNPTPPPPPPTHTQTGSPLANLIIFDTFNVYIPSHLGLVPDQFPSSMHLWVVLPTNTYPGKQL